jgi:hypothetical protein
MVTIRTLAANVKPIAKKDKIAAHMMPEML